MPSHRRLGPALVAPLVCALAVVIPRPAASTQRFGPLQLSGNLQTTSLVRHPDASTYQYVQNRNVARVRLEYQWLQGGRLYDRYDVPFIESSNLFILWRGVYDSVYDTTPHILEKEDIHGRAYQGKTWYQFGRENRGLGPRFFQLDGLGQEGRDTLKFDNQLREAYLDIKFRGLPLSVRGGRQQVVWGETDNFRMLDRVNSLNFTWHFQQELPTPAFGWDEIRRPFWMIKFLYDLGDVWKFSQSFLEWYWNPGDWNPGKQAFLPNPWGFRFSHPLTNPIDGAFVRGVCENAPGRRCTTLMNDTRIFEQGDYTRNPLDNSQVGIRYHGIAPRGLEFTLNYFYQRFAGDDGTNYAPLRALPNNPRNNELCNGAHGLISQGIFCAEANIPYVHTIGASANYSDETYTQTVFRAETIYDVGIPFFDAAKTTVVDSPRLPGVTNKNMWKGMIGFDRPTWIRTLNRRGTFFLSGQFFWHYLVNNPDCRGQTIATAKAQGRARNVESCLVGGLDLPSSVRNNSSSESPAFRDKIRDWESIFTLAAFTFYRGGSVVPVVGMAVDWVNQWNMEPFWDVDWVVRDDLVVNLGQRYFVTPRGAHTPIFETWGLAGLNGGRSETTIRLTFQF